MRTSCRLGLLLLVTLTTLAGAQDSPPLIVGPRASEVLGVVAQGPLRRSLAVDTAENDVRPTHWKEGALIGGLTAGLGLALLFDGICRSSDGDCGSAVPGAFLLGGVLGGVIGALIGGQFPETEDP